MELKGADECRTVLEPLPRELRSQHGSELSDGLVLLWLIPVAHILTYSSLQLHFGWAKGSWPYIRRPGRWAPFDSTHFNGD